MAQLFTGCQLCNLDPEREPVYNGANCSCQEMSRSSEWDIVSMEHNLLVDDNMSLSFTTSGTAGTEGENAQIPSLGESEKLPNRPEMVEVWRYGSKVMPSLLRWLESQGPWNCLLAADKLRATQPNICNDLEVDFCDSLDRVQNIDVEEGGCSQVETEENTCSGV